VVLDVLDVAMHEIDVALHEMDRVGSILPDGYSLLAAVCGPDGQVGDLFIRDRSGQTSVVLGLSEQAVHHLGRLLDVASADFEPARPRSPPALFSTVEGPSLYRTIVEECPVPLVVIGRTGVIEFASPAVGAEFGFDPATQVVGRPWREFVHPDDLRRLGSLARLGNPNELSGRKLAGRVRRPDGFYVSSEAVARTVIDAGGAVEGMVVALRESRANRIEFEEMVTAERRQRALADAADCGIALLAMRDEEFGTVLDANRTFGRLIGGGSGLIAGASIADLVSSGDAVRCSEALRVVAETGQPRRLEVRLAATPDRQTELVIAVDRISGDPPSRMTARLRDITEQRGFIAELSRNVERLQQTNRELAEFARVTTHDLAAPLRAASGLLDLVSGAVDSEVTETLNAVRSAITRMSGMVDAAIGHAQTENPDIRWLPVDLNRTLGHVIDALREEIAESGAEVSGDELPTVLGDEPQLERLLLNLIANAIKYAGPSSPRTRVTARRDDDGWTIAVADEGVGIEPGTEERIFDLFERGAAGRPMRLGTGRGIGLATCRRIVERHGGQIWATRNEPKGSILQFTLPDNPTAGVALCA
jgi:PAS domain S-box-containing protein